MEREIVPELIQERLTAQNITVCLRQMLIDSQYNAKLREQLQIIKDMLGSKGVMTRAAKEIVELLQ